MANVVLYIDDSTAALTLQVLLESAGHKVGPEPAGVVVTDKAARAVREAAQRPTLILTTAPEVPAAVDAMRHGVFGYILLPFVPGEAALMVERASNGYRPSATPPARGDGPTEEGWPSLEEVETRHIVATLQRFRNNYSRTARALGIGRNTLWRKMKKIRIEE